MIDVTIATSLVAELIVSIVRTHTALTVTSVSDAGSADAVMIRQTQAVTVSYATNAMSVMSAVTAHASIRRVRRHLRYTITVMEAPVQ